MATRFDFTNDARTLGQIAASFPTIDHFHCVEIEDGEEYVFHYAVIDGRVLELPQGSIDVTDDVASSWARVFGDEI